MSSTPETFTAPERTGSTRKVTRDAVLSAAEQVARGAVVAEEGPEVGEHLGFELEGERLGTHYFTTTAAGYVGWRWFVTLTRAPRSRTPIVAEAGLLPGEGALLPPAWVPWSERLAPGDVGTTDRLPYDASDERLEQGYVATGDAETDRIAIRELGLGRDRVMTRPALDAAATRWYHGDSGPDTSGSRKAGADCATCGFLVPLSGHLGALFGVCANEWSPDDGKVVSLDHGCGAHSETDVRRQGGEWNQSDPHLDDLELEVVQAVERSRAEEDDDGAAAGEDEAPAPDKAGAGEAGASEAGAGEGAARSEGSADAEALAEDDGAPVADEVGSAAKSDDDSPSTDDAPVDSDGQNNETQSEDATGSADVSLDDHAADDGESPTN